MCTLRPANGYRNRWWPSREVKRSTSSRPRCGSCDSRACVCSIGIAACISGLVEVALRGAVQQRQHGVGHLAGQRHLAAGPGRHHALGLGGLAHVGRHVLRAHVLQHAAGEDEAVALVQPRDETFLDGADGAARQPLHLHARVADDGADLQPVAPGDAAVGHAPAGRRPARRGGTRGRPCRLSPPRSTKASAQSNCRARQRRVGRRAAHLVEQRVGLEAAAQRHRHQVLHQHVQRLCGAAARLHLPGQRGAGARPRLPPAPACWSAPASRGWAGPARGRCGRRAAAAAPRPWRCRSAARVRPAGSPRPGPG